MSTTQLPQSIAPPLLRGELGGFDLRDPNGVYTPSLSLIALKMWPQPTYPKNIAPLLWWEVGMIWLQIFKFTPIWGLHNKLELNTIKNVATTHLPQNIFPLSWGVPPLPGGIGRIWLQKFTHQVRGHNTPTPKLAPLHGGRVLLQ